MVFRWLGCSGDLPLPHQCCMAMSARDHTSDLHHDMLGPHPAILLTTLARLEDNGRDNRLPLS
eukprot:8447221-Pyramimonas_sp.AAC.1